MRPLPKSSIASALLLALLQSLSRPASADEVVKSSKSLSERCQMLSNEGNYPGALDACERAYELSSDPGILAYIAQVQTALLHPVEARDALNRYLAGPLSDENRKTAEAQVRYLETLIATLRVATEFANPEVRVDDRVLDAKALALGLPLPAGAHQVTLKANGAVFSQFVVLRAGEVTRLELPSSGSIALSCAIPQVRFYVDDREVSAADAQTGVSSAAGSHRVSFRAGGNAWPDTRITVNPGERASVVCSAPPPTTHASPARSSMNPRGYWVAGVGLLLGGAALATAIYNGSEYDRWQTANDSLKRDILSQDLPLSEQAQRAQENNQLMDSIQTRRNVALGLGIAGGLLTAGGVALLFADSAKYEQRRASSWVTRLVSGVSFDGGPSSGHVAWRGAW
jgi:hypothetical protein